MDFSKIKSVYFVGIGGIGVSAVAKMMLRQGLSVSGSDVTKTEITEELESRGIKIVYEHKAANLPANFDLLIYSSAVPENNPERSAARDKKAREMSYFDFLGKLSRQYKTIAVSGTNGKSTTTAMLGLILERAGLDPTVIVGSKVKTFPDGNLRLGSAPVIASPAKAGGGNLPTNLSLRAERSNLPVLVVEACEYNAHMLKLFPQMIVLTNIEEDHLDYYRDLNHIKQTFREYLQKLPSDGLLIYNYDDEATHELVNQESRIRNQGISYGINLPADYLARNIRVKSGHQYFDILRTNKHEEVLGNFALQIPGKFNIYNALAAASAALSLGIQPEIIKETLENFSGIWRRFENVGERDGAIIISDYGHHPTAIRETLRAAREFYPDRRIVLVYQPHQRNRTRRLFNDFVSVLQIPDVLILSEIYDVTGRENPEDAGISSKQLYEKIIQEKRKLSGDSGAHFAQNLDEAETLITRLLRSNDLVIIMGAGDVDKIARRLIK